jgi:hypothetical protein
MSLAGARRPLFRRRTVQPDRPFPLSVNWANGTSARRLFELIEIGEDPHHNLFVLPVPTLGNIQLRHVFEIHRMFLALRRHATSLLEQDSR